MATPVDSSRTLELRADHELLQLLCGQEPQPAFTEIVKRYTNLVYGTCLRILRDTTLAEDAVQATFLILWRKRAGVQTVQALAAWLYRVAERTARDAQNMRRRRTSYERNLPLMEKAQTPELEDVLPHLDQALAQLPSDQRDVIVMRYLRGMSRTEISDAMHCPVATVHSRLNLGISKLRTKLERRGIGASIAMLPVWLEQVQTNQTAPAALPSRVVNTCLQNAVSPAVAALAHAATSGLSKTAFASLATAATLVLASAVLGVMALTSANTPAPVFEGQTPIPATAAAAPLPPGAALTASFSDKHWTTIGDLPVRITPGRCEINPDDLRAAAHSAGMKIGGAALRKPWDLRQGCASIKMKLDASDHTGGFEILAQIAEDEAGLDKAACPGLRYYFNSRDLAVHSELFPKKRGLPPQTPLQLTVLQPGVHELELAVSQSELLVKLNGETLARAAHGAQGRLARLIFQLSTYEPGRAKAEAKEIISGANKELNAARASDSF